MRYVLIYLTESSALIEVPENFLIELNDVTFEIIRYLPDCADIPEDYTDFPF